ncbi:MAG: Na+/H+ antiporter NhaC family protein [marine benthic group bacterium]|nr:Na+/H+ antiporter NhaC family protein [Gemmatimonadota bacterium]MCL7980668.1 Na+/H+ antiporter NhaC family protein [Gemmatimonadota bacterium]
MKRLVTALLATTLTALAAPVPAVAVTVSTPTSDVAVTETGGAPHSSSVSVQDAPSGDDAADAEGLVPVPNPGWTSLLPPLVAIALALVFKEVVVSLFFGVWLGALLYTGLNPISATMRTIDSFITPALVDADHAAIIVFSFLLAGMVGVISRSGGTRGIVEAVRPLATSPRRAQLATYLSGLAIFFDDYANTLIVGNTMRPITDRMRVSREKLAYIVDSTAAPVAAIVFVSTWVGFEISLIGDGLAAAAAQSGGQIEIAALADANPFTVFLHSIPYLFYPILALIMVGLVITLQRDFGPMLRAEQRASRGDGLYREGAMLMSEAGSEHMEPEPGTPLRWYNAVLPVVTVIVVVLLGLYFEGRANLGRPGTIWEVFGEANAFHALLWGSLAGCLMAIALAVGQRILPLADAIGSMVGGMRAMLLAGLILVLAWSLSSVTEVLGTAQYLSGLLEGNLRPEFLPVLVFLTAASISFATGTSWGTMAILIPLVIPLAVGIGGAADFDAGSHYSILLGSISSVLAGAIFGDHCSPISDTTVLSSMASACDHVDHVRTQLPYALTVGVVGMLVGDIPTAFGLPPWISYLVGATILFSLLRFVGKKDFDSPQWAGSAEG